MREIGRLTPYLSRIAIRLFIGCLRALRKVDPNSAIVPPDSLEYLSEGGEAIRLGPFCELMQISLVGSFWFFLGLCPALVWDGNGGSEAGGL